MAKEYLSKAAPINFGAIEALVHQGKAVVSSEDSAVVESVLKTLAEGRTATFYLKPTVFEAIRRRYWTAERAEAANLKPIPAETAARVKSELNIEVDGYANSLDCPRCGHVYSTYEFIQQGFKQHGEEVVRAAFSLKRVAILQVNPVQNPICPNCRLDISLAGYGAWYDYDYSTSDGERYACCQLNDIVITAANLKVSPD